MNLNRSTNNGQEGTGVSGSAGVSPASVLIQNPAGETPALHPSNGSGRCDRRPEPLLVRGLKRWVS